MLKRLFGTLSNGACEEVDHFATLVREDEDDSLQIDRNTKNLKLEKKLRENTCKDCLKKKNKDVDDDGETYAKSMICHKCNGMSEGNILCLECAEDQSMCIVCGERNIEVTDFRRTDSSDKYDEEEELDFSEVEDGTTSAVE